MGVFWVGGGWWVWKGEEDSLWGRGGGGDTGCRWENCTEFG